MSKSSLSGESAKHLFFYLLLFVALYITLFSLIGALWALIDHYIVDYIDSWRQNAALDTLRGFLSALIVTSPIYLYMSYQLTKASNSTSALAKSTVRKWLTYLTLFVSSLTVIITLITLVNSVLSGDSTLQFMLKAFTILLIAGGTLLFYHYDLKKHA